MRRTPPAVLLAFLLTLGSGLLNLYSVIGPSLPERVVRLREVFPLEFIRLSRSATLLIGFALVIVSLNIYRRKRRAWLIAVLLAGFSVLFHLAKGVDYEEATVSALLLATLWATRHRYSVKSRGGGWALATRRSLLALALALVYGITGFWLLAPREFGIDFNLLNSVERTMHFFLLQGDPSLQPRTHYAIWFQDSLYLISLASFLYVGFAFFRPALYQFRTHPHEIEQAKAVLERYGRSSQDFFKARPDKSFYWSSGHDCFLAYRVGGNFAVVLGDPIGPEDAIEPIIRRFVSYCADNDWGLGFHQALPDFLDVYQRLGFKKLKIGDDAIVDLTSFTLQGPAAKTFRSKVNLLEKAGIRTEYVPPPIPGALIAQLKEVSDEWLNIPGRRERQFTLGMFDEEYISSTPVVTAQDENGKVLAFVNLVPSYRRGETTVDLMRRCEEAPNGIMDYVFVRTFLLSKERGFERFNLGMAPMAGFQQQEEASPEERAIHAFFQHLNFLFSFKGLLAYKAKFATIWEPRYVVYRRTLELPRLAIALGKVSELPD
ncbi:MAG: phosphatidylglycerol lysyltransferase domain-containing protein [Bryobacteraceae bacterium]